MRDIICKSVFRTNRVQLNDRMDIVHPYVFCHFEKKNLQSNNGFIGRNDCMLLRKRDKINAGSIRTSINAGHIWMLRLRFHFKNFKNQVYLKPSLKLFTLFTSLLPSRHCVLGSPLINQNVT